jgi:RNA polymerase sigma-70 factor (ECF subfamily)
MALAKSGGGAQPLQFDACGARFLEGRRDAMAECYREFVGTVDGAVARYVGGVDRETVIEEVFFRLVSEPDLRAAYGGGCFAAWLSTVARNQAIDYLRRQRHQVGVDPDTLGEAAAQESFERQTVARELIAYYRAQVPAAWQSVFDARFLAQLNQQEAADLLGISRTTLAYREMRIRRLLLNALRRMDRE